MTLPLEGDEIVCVPETDDADEVKEGIISAQKEDDRTEAHQACEEEDTLRPHDTVGMAMMHHCYARSYLSLRELLSD